MGDQEEKKLVTRREVLKLAGTAAAFCTSFGFLHGGQAGVTQDKHLKIMAHKDLQLKWAQADLKWYKGNELLGTSPFPMKALKHLQSDEAAAVELKLFRGGNLLKNLGTVESKF